MQHAHQAWLTAFTICSLCAPAPSYGDTLVPNTVQFENSIKDDAYGKVCEYVLLILNLPAPETVNFHVQVMRPMSNGKLIDPTLVGFSMDVGELRFSGGMPAGGRKVNLATAAFSSLTFSSAGRLNIAPFGDGGISGSTTDRSTGNEFMNAFLKGGYDLSFTREDWPGIRSYHLSSSPLMEVVKSFHACLRTLL